MSRAPASAGTAAATRRRPTLPDPPTLAVSGDFVQNVMVVPTSTTSMLLGMGYLEDEHRHVLVPYVEIKIAGVTQGEMGPSLKETDFNELFSHVLPLDNALFMAWDLVRDMRIACTRVQQLSGGGMALENVRLAHARNFAERLRGQAELCVTILDELISDAIARSAKTSSEEVDAEAGQSPAKAAEPKRRLRRTPREK